MKQRKALRRISEKGKVKRKIKMELVKNDAGFYWDIWQERFHTDFETGKPITGEFNLAYFHHVLPKRPDGGYPQYRHCRWNIVLVSKDTHNQAEGDMDKTPRIRAYYNKLLSMHDSGVLESIDPAIHQL